jgi:hypothetical protein
MVLLVPVVVITLAAFFAAAVLSPHRARLKSARVPGLLLTAQLALIPLSWLLIRAAPERPDNDAGGAATCPDVETWTATFYILVFGSSLLGGLTIGSAYAGDRPEKERAIGFAVFAVVAPYVIAGLWIAAALCGGTWN